MFSTLSRCIVVDRFNGKPLTVTFVLGGRKREYTGESAEAWEAYLLGKQMEGVSNRRRRSRRKSTFVVLPRASVHL